MIGSVWKSLIVLIMAIAIYAAAGESYAASAADAATAKGYMNSIINQPYDNTDLAHKSLVRLFGGFVFKPFGGAPAESATVLAKVLGYTNVIAMILGVIIMAYVLVAGALNTAASGEMLGRSWSSVWLPLRTSLAFGMIVPATNGGEVFSVAQSLVIWMIIVGSNSATWLWKQGSESLLAGDPVMPKVSFHSGKAATPAINTIFCSVVKGHIVEKRNTAAPVIGHVYYVNSIDYTVSKYSQADITLDNLGSVSLTNATKIVLDGCGTISFPNSASVLSGTQFENSQGSGLFTKGIAWQKQVQDKFNESTRNNYNSFITKAKSMSEQVYASGLTRKKIDSAMSVGGDQAIAMQKLVDAAGQDYGNTLLAYENYLSTIQSETLGAASAAGWGDDMTKGGWMRAGAWFFEASRLQGFVQTLLGSINQSGTYTPSPPNGCSFASSYTNCKDQREEYQSWSEALLLVNGASAASPGATAAASAKGVMNITSTVKVDDGAMETLDSKALDTVSVQISTLFMNSIMSMGEDDALGSAGNVSHGGSGQATSTTGMISPFTAVTSLGRGLQQIGVGVWTAGLGVSALLGVNDSPAGSLLSIFSASSTSALAGSAKYVMASLAPVLAGVGGLAFMLAFAIPFMPVTIWIMLVCGYLVTVIEAIAAAPLAVIMLATPEGEGISGTGFKQALQMINAIILRPSLSIVGLFAAMTLSYAGFAILNDLFWSVAGLATDMSIFEILAMIFIYSTLAFKLCEYMISVIHKIPDQIMQWMGGGMSREFGETAAGQDMSQAVQRNTAASGVSGMAGLKTASGIAQNKIETQRQREMHKAMTGKDRDGIPG